MKHDLETLRSDYVNLRRFGFVRISDPARDEDPAGTWIRFTSDCDRQVIR